MHPNKFQMCRMDNISLFPPNLKVSDIVTMETIVQSIGTQLTELQVKIWHMTQMPHAQLPQLPFKPKMWRFLLFAYYLLNPLVFCKLSKKRVLVLQLGNEIAVKAVWIYQVGFCMVWFLGNQNLYLGCHINMY